MIGPRWRIQEALEGPLPEPPTTEELDGLCRSFPKQTALGVDALHPRSVLYLPDEGKCALCLLMKALLVYGEP
eukprot:12924316-Prorocentrum_lima.AAC.1